MKRKFQLLICFFSIFLALPVFADFQTNLDSLNNRYTKVFGQEKLETLLEMSRAYWDTEPGKGIEIATRALATAQSLGYDQEIVKAMFYLGTAYYKDNQYDFSLDYLLQAYRFAKNHDYQKEVADISHQLATVYYQSGKINKIYNYTEEANTIYKQLDDKVGIARCLNMFGVYYQSIRDYDQAIDYLQKGLKLGKEISHRSIVGELLNDIGSLYTEMGDTLKAIRTYHEAVDYYKSNGPNNKTGVFELNMSDLYLHHNDLIKAKHHLDKGYLVGKQLKSKRLLRDYYKYLSLYYTKLGDYKNSVIAYQNLQSYQDSIASEHLSNKIDDLDSRHMENIKNQENQALRAENQTQQLEINRQYTIGLLILLLLLVVIFLLTFRYRNNLKDNELLYLRNRLVSQHQEELIGAMKRLKESEDKLRTANETKDKMFSLIAHDLRGAIGNISNGLRMMLTDKELDLSEEDKTEFLQSLFHSADNSFELLENLLFWAKNQTSTISANLQMVDASSIISSNINLSAELAKIKSIRLIASTNPSVEVYIDWNMINTVLRNLISNAIKFTNKGGIIEVKSEIGEYFVKISVIDNGIGMMPDQIENIYEGKTTDGTANEKGTGLGITLCRDFLVKNHGEMMVESEVDKGSTFSFIIPRRPMSDEKFSEFVKKETLISFVNV
ncbi:tetratricopeptide repeat protein [Labilibaculum sp. A4]|uniref:tetratricopeptide repeat-containing sensor histidine kinase n=1 Tax=Labilibaculum euxinus TaxID=2686357 RepID=UPI000F618522|nr:tetratricopeptide repeat-containing sensor histidine kinase [Labilibaculum euxinus]MDQ1771758.1 tetratricopeptide repeat-containing sensor histidine kinase [Labilibaculum euxinus]MWN77253.1 tetratricopeptide repeat protein [Labilibaculum euxinus]